MPKPSEVATIHANGQIFRDWESVWIQHRWAEAWANFRFTCAERDPIPSLWDKLQLKPGDDITIKLAGIIAMVGFIVDRQVAYDANNHGILLMGRGATWLASRSSVDVPTGNFDDMTFEQVARKVLAPYPVGIKVIGSLDATPYKRLQNEKGETVWDFLERIARPRGIVLGSDHLGNILLIGDHTNPVIGDLVEGENILKCQCTISLANIFAKYTASNSGSASDDHLGPAASEQEASVITNTIKKFTNTLHPSPFPVWSDGELQVEAKNEAVWHEGTIVEASITVQGWLRPSTQNLWRAGDNVRVRSPMALLNQVMKIQTATFTQDRQSGTLTTLDCVVPWLLRDKIYTAIGAVSPESGLPKEPGLGTSQGANPVPAPKPDPAGNAERKDPPPPPTAPPTQPE